MSAAADTFQALSDRRPKRTKAMGSASAEFVKMIAAAHLTLDPSDGGLRAAPQVDMILRAPRP
jgi:hypothetical protein